MNIVVLLGAPGSGKGTVAARLVSDAVKHLSSGALLRGAIQAGTAAGIQAQSFMDKGELVPDQLIAQMVGDYLSTETQAKTLLLDGFPRTLPQAEMLDTILTQAGATIRCALLLDVEDSVVIERISGRLVCPGCGEGYHATTLPPKQAGICDRCGAALATRADDQPETVKHRLEVYAAQTFPLIAYYRDKGLLRTIDGNGNDLDAKVISAKKEIN